MKRLFRIILITLGLTLCLCSCKANLKPYERVYVDDSEMQMAESSSALKFNRYVHSIREGAVKAKQTKGNGGCGCN